MPTLTYFSNRSTNNTKKIKHWVCMKICSTLVEMVSDWVEFILSKLSAICGWGIETFYLVTKLPIWDYLQFI